MILHFPARKNPLINLCFRYCKFILNKLLAYQVLLSLIEKGITREKAYKIVQECAMEVWKKRIPFADLLKKDKEVSKLMSDEEIEEIFDINYHLKHVDSIFERVFK